MLPPFEQQTNSVSKFDFLQQAIFTGASLRANALLT